MITYDLPTAAEVFPNLTAAGVNIPQHCVGLVGGAACKVLLAFEAHAGIPGPDGTAPEIDQAKVCVGRCPGVMEPIQGPGTNYTNCTSPDRPGQPPTNTIPRLPRVRIIE